MSDTRIVLATVGLNVPSPIFISRGCGIISNSEAKGSTAKDGAADPTIATNKITAKKLFDLACKTLLCLNQRWKSKFHLSYWPSDGGGTTWSASQLWKLSSDSTTIYLPP